jgi:Lon protease-like protein
MSDDLKPISHFQGPARLFPLPNLVLFPHVVQPLHIFEPRYRQMTADALAGDRLIALALLRPGWETDYQGRPSVHRIACLGRIVADQRLADGRYNLLLRGVVRLQIEEECASEKLYRSVRGKIALDQGSVGAKLQLRMRERLSALLPTWFAAQQPLVEQFNKLLEGDLPLGALCDVMTFALPLPVEFKQLLLEELNVERRIRRLLRHLKAHGITPSAESEERLFPPSFSQN